MGGLNGTRTTQYINIQVAIATYQLLSRSHLSRKDPTSSVRSSKMGLSTFGTELESVREKGANKISAIAKTKVTLFSLLKKKRTTKFMRTAASAMQSDRRNAVEATCQKIREYTRKNLKGGKAGRYIKSGGKKGRSADIRISLGRLEENIGNSVRFSPHPVHACLVAALSFTIESQATRKTPIVSAEFRTISENFGEMAVKLLDCVIMGELNEEERWRKVIHKRISGHSVLDLALILEHDEFLTHPFVVKFVDTAWVGDMRKLVLQNGGFSAPDIYEFLEEEMEAAGWKGDTGLCWLGGSMVKYSKVRVE